ncbi:MAG: hypothetical protein ROO76_00265 [Terriglobia bacterium]|jgi:hypothetical protein|nr:hypothetical protein [Terriglobia bacterium]
MKACSILALGVLALFPILSAAADKQKPDLDRLKAEADKAVARAETANPKDCTKDCLEAARRLVDLSDQYFTLGNVQDAHTAMNNAGRFALKAGHDSLQTKKRRKETEIGLRKLQWRISQIEETLNFDDRPSVHKIVNSISRTRSDILMSMFDQPKKELGPAPPDKENP